MIARLELNLQWLVDDIQPRFQGRVPHSLRRGCAGATTADWDVEEIRLLLGDTAAVIKPATSIWNWLKLVGRTQERSTARTPAATCVQATDAPHGLLQPARSSADLPSVPGRLAIRPHPPTRSAWDTVCGA